MLDRVLITGGAGFIGSHLAEYSLKKGREVTIVDNLSRTDYNIRYLQQNYKNLKFVNGDVRNPKIFDGLIDDIDLVYHCAAQVAVTTSLTNPRLDYETNADGTFNLCEAIRNSKSDAAIVFCSTSRVYGNPEVRVLEKGSRYDYRDIVGINETYPLDGNCPYGGSKIISEWILGTFYKTFGIKSVRARMSCIYGPRQLGNEYQDWIAWFTIATILGKKITVYGDLKRTRDVLYITDQNEAFELLARNINRTKGKYYNIGGGPSNTISVPELLNLINELTGKRSEIVHEGWQIGDQRVYVSDISTINKEIGWSPTVGVRAGVKNLVEWVTENKSLLSQ